MLPKILKPFHSDKSNLVRIGPKKDGGYVIDKRVIEKSEVIITCGLNDDWEFEKDFLNKNNSSRVEHEATTSKVDDEQLFYCHQRGIGEEEAVALIVNGFCKEVLQALPMEFAMEAQALVAISLEGSVG